MQFKVPQNVQREDRIVGPLTLKQLIICGIGGSIAYGLYVGLAEIYIPFTALIPAVIIGAITLAFAFLRPLDLSFTRWIIRWIEFSLIPKKRPWIKSSAEIMVPAVSKKSLSKAKKKKEEDIDIFEEKQRKMKELAKLLDSGKRAPLQ